MHTFTDNTGVEWHVKATALTLGRVEDALGVSFSDAGSEDGPFIRIAVDAMFAFRVAFALCEPQIKERGLTDEQFSERLIGDALGRAQKAMTDAVIDFLPDPERRAAAARTVEALRAFERETIKQAAADLDSINLEEAVKEMLANA